MPDPHVTHIVEELAIRHVLHHDENVRRSVNYLVQANDVRVAALFENIDLPLHLFRHVQLLDTVAIQNFDSHVLSRHDVRGVCKKRFGGETKPKTERSCQRGRQ